MQLPQLLRRLTGRTTPQPNTLEQFAASRRGRRISAQLMQQTDSLTRKDIAAWRAAWQMAIDYHTPQRARLYDIYTDCLVDLHLSGCIGQRKGKTLHKAFRLADTQGNEHTQATQMMQAGWFYDFMDLALDSRFWGHSLIQLGDVEGQGYDTRYTHVELVPRKHVCPEYGVVTTHPQDDWRTGTPYRTGPLSDWCVEVGLPRDLGLLLKCAPACISKKNMLSYWDMFGEVFGAPIRVARTSSTDAAEVARLETAMQQMGSAAWAVLSEGTDMEIKETSRGDAYNVYDRRVDRCNSELSKGVLMQTMTIDNGSSLSQSETHLEVFSDVVQADARMLQCVINDRLLPHMLRHGFPVQGLRFEWDDAATFSPEQQLAMERMLLDKYDIDPQYFIDKYNVAITGTRQDGGGNLRQDMTQQQCTDRFFA